MIRGRRLERIAPSRVAAVLLVACGLLWSPSPAGAEAGVVVVAAWRCPAEATPAADDPAAFAALCLEPADGLSFNLTVGGRSRVRTTADGRPVEWRPVVGPITIALNDPPNASFAVFCAGDDATWTPAAVSDATISTEAPADTGLSCRWYLLAPAAPPTAVPTPTSAPTAPPTATTVPAPTPAPPATATPTATLAPTATASPTFAPTPTAAPAAEVTITPILNLFSSVHDINAVGQVAASFSDVERTGNHAAIWQDGRVTELEPVSERTSFASAINVDGVVVGMCQSAETERFVACLWRNGPRTSLGTLGGDRSQAFDINDAGQVVGESETGAAGESHAFLWQNGEMTALATLGGTHSRAEAINATGQVVGVATSPDGGLHAVLWENGEIRDLGNLGGDSRALDINDAGQVVGWSDTVADGHQAFLWRDGQMERLDGLSGNDLSLAASINDLDQIVGWSYDLDENGNPTANLRATLWDQGRSVDLTALLPTDSGWRLERAIAIADDGTIVGDGLMAPEADRRRPYLLTLAQDPTPPDLVGGPPEVVVGEARFSRDRALSLNRSEIVPVNGGPPALFARAAEPPFAAVYAESTAGDGQMIRYLPQQTASPQPPCPAERPGTLPYVILEEAEVVYSFAGTESDLTVDRLIPTNFTLFDGDVFILAESATSPWAEIFLADGATLERYIALDPQGLPFQIGESMSFAGQAFTHTREATPRQEGRVRIGCVGPFPLWADQGGTSAPYGRVYVGVLDKHFAFDATDGLETSADPTPVPPSPADARVTVELASENDSGVTGAAVMTPDGDRTLVVIQLVGAEPGTEGHMFDSTCDDHGGASVFHDFDPVNAIGRSETLIDAPFTELTTGDYWIHLHQPAVERGGGVVCGNVPEYRADSGSEAAVATATAAADLVAAGDYDYGLDIPAGVRYPMADRLNVYPLPGSSGELSVGDFVAEAVFQNPPEDVGGVWDYGFLFGPTGGPEDYRLYVRADGLWALDFGSVTVQSGQLGQLNTAATETNTLRLVVAEGTAFFYVNDEHVVTLDVPAAIDGGKLWLATSFLDGQILCRSLGVWLL